MLDTLNKAEAAFKKIEPAAFAMMTEYATHHSSHNDGEDDVAFITQAIALSHAISARRQADALKLLVIILGHTLLVDPDAVGSTQGQLDVPLKGQIEGPKHG